VTGVPSAFVMCASYLAWPSASLSIGITSLRCVGQVQGGGRV
jgi:hypothetical protein